MSAAQPKVAWLRGELVAFGEARLPIEDRGLQFGESLYEVVAIAGGQPRLLPEHARRMLEGAKLVGIDTGVPRPDAWSAIVASLQREERLEEGLLIAQITGGTAPRSHLPAEPPTPTFLAYLRAYRFPREAEVARGIRAISRPDPRWAACDLKTTMLLPNVMAKREAAARGAQEALFVGDDGALREGASSNLFVVERGALATPAQSRHLLPGLTRPLVAGLAREAGRELHDAELPLERALRADELFVTSTTFTVMPVTELDGRPIGDGRAGPIAVDLARRLRAAWELR